MKGLCGARKFLAVMVALVFLCGVAGLADAKSGGGSSFSGGSRSSVSSGSSGYKSSSPSGSGFGSSKSSTPSGFGSSKSSTPSGFGSSKSSSPTASPSKPATSSSSWFGSSKGSSAPADTPKTGSAFSGGVDKGISDQKANSGQPASKTYSAPSGGYSGSSNVTNTTRTNTVIIRERPMGWTPTYYYGGYSPSHDMIDMWWKFEMLKELHDSNERNRLMREMQSDPKYGVWKAEADRAAAENKELKAQLAKADTELQNAPVETKDDMSVKPKKKSHLLFWLVVLLIIGGCGYGIYRMRR